MAENKSVSNPFAFRIINPSDIPWDIIEGTSDSTPYKTRQWAEFLRKSQGVEPYVIEIKENQTLLGYFYGERVKRIVHMVVSPIEGWTTSFQGLSTILPIGKGKRVNIYKHLAQWLFHTGQGSFFQVMDWQLEIEDVEGILSYEKIEGYRLDLRQDFETEIYKGFKEKSAKYSIKKAKKQGVVIRHASDVMQFTDHYYEQLQEVFERQGLKPTYTKDRILKLGQSLVLDKSLLLLEAIYEGQCIATGIFVRDNNLAIYYGAASWSKYRNLCPNELLMYEAIKWLSESGTKEMEFGGGRKYKEKYGPHPYCKPRIVIAKYPFLIVLKNKVKKVYYGIRTFLAMLKKGFRHGHIQ